MSNSLHALTDLWFLTFWLQHRVLTVNFELFAPNCTRAYRIFRKSRITTPYRLGIFWMCQSVFLYSNTSAQSKSTSWQKAARLWKFRMCQSGFVTKIIQLKINLESRQKAARLCTFRMCQQSDLLQKQFRPK